MNRSFTLAVLILLSGRLFAQVPARGRQQAAALPPPLSTREVSGIVKDPKGETVIGATITLAAGKDTLRTATNEDGIFIFKDVKQATFIVTINGIGYLPQTRKYLNNDAVKHIVLDPIELKTQENLLNEVKIDGTPSITYKTDTVEYRASDYKVRPNATVDEVLKKMEGMEVGTDGTLTHQGQQVTRAKLNGKEFSGGNVAQAIQNLPADIVDKIQIVDDYGDQAAKTGIKDGDPEKILNITTKADRSVGTMLRSTAQYGSNDRYNAQLSVQRINANQVLSLIGNFRNTVNGVASSGLSTDATGGAGNLNANGGGGSGTTRSLSPSFSYRDQWSKKTQVVGNYSYNYTDNNSLNQSYGERYTSIGRSNFNEQSTRDNENRGHRFNFEISHDIDSSNYLQITPTFSNTSSNSLSNSLTDNINNYTVTGFEHRLEKALSSQTNNANNYGLTAFYLHVFKKPKRNLSIQVALTHSTSQSNTDRNTNTKNFADSTQNTLILDSLSHILTDRSSNSTNYNTTVTYVEPLTKSSLLELVGQVRHSINDNVALSDTVLANGQIQRNPAMDNIYNYSFTESRASVNYRYNGTKVNFSLGAAYVPYILNGTKVDNNTGLEATTSRSYSRLIPVFRFSYAWSRTERLQLTYTGRNAELNFLQIQPFVDRSNPNNIIIGNPDLKPTFTHTVSANYNNYLANSKLNFSLITNATIFDNQVTTNVYRRAVPISPGQNRTINEVNYVNLGGSKQFTARYNIAKSFSDRKYSLSLNGSVSYNYGTAMSEGLQYHNTNWNIRERFGPRIAPNEWLEINPYLGYELSRTFSTSLNAPATSLQTSSLGLTGRMYFLKTFQVNYSAAKSYVTGLGTYNTSPLILNAGFEKEFGTKRSLVLTFNVFDLLHQNNFVQQEVTSQGITNTLSNALSRYFLVGLRLNLQKWSGKPQRNGINMQRRGDGSFIY